MATWPTSRVAAPDGARWRAIRRKAARGPVCVGAAGRASHVVLTLEAYGRLAATEATRIDASAPLVTEIVADARAGAFSVLCRIDAFADYIAVVEADDPKDAAQLAYDDHSAYTWTYHHTAEFDNRCYIALDDQGDEIDGTEIGDF